VCRFDRTSSRASSRRERRRLPHDDGNRGEDQQRAGDDADGDRLVEHDHSERYPDLGARLTRLITSACPRDVRVKLVAAITG
jgi:hypothetical protein